MLKCESEKLKIKKRQEFLEQQYVSFIGGCIREKVIIWKGKVIYLDLEEYKDFAELGTSNKLSASFLLWVKEINWLESEQKQREQKLESESEKFWILERQCFCRA